MIIDYSTDGEICDIQNLKNKGFEINIDKDIIKYTSNGTDSYIENDYQYNFVGFLVNKDNDIKTPPKSDKPKKVLSEDYDISH